MARKTIVTLVDDLTNEEIPENGGETVTFSLDGKTYELDLTHDNARSMRDTMGQYVKVARMANLGHEKRRGPRLHSAGGRTNRDESKAIRQWARSQGEQVPDRGRIPAALMERWEALSGTEKALAVQAVRAGAEQQTLTEPEAKTTSRRSGRKGKDDTTPTEPPEFSDTPSDDELAGAAT